MHISIDKETAAQLLGLIAASPKGAALFDLSTWSDDPLRKLICQLHSLYPELIVPEDLGN